MNLRPLYCDQLSFNLASLKDLHKDNDVILLAEVMEEATYVKHHKKKLAFQFSSMRHFAVEMEEKGFHVRYVKLDDSSNSHSMLGEIERAVEELECETVILTEPGEYRQQQDIQSLEKKLKVPVEIYEDDRFFTNPTEFKEWASSQKSLLMENFYRMMRKKTGLLMDGDKPEGGQWNYDKENRGKLDPDVKIPRIPKLKPDEITKEVINLVEDNFKDHFGELDNFSFAVTHEQAETIFQDFLENRLPNFGQFQDAMKSDEPFLFHSIISPYLNNGLLDPKEVCKRAIDEYHKGRAPLNSVEGFVRQILGWREFIRGIYWVHMPEYVDKNHLNSKRDLPDFYWTGETRMNCLHQVITMTQKEAYSHHIQRLMVTGNFALLTQIDPKQVHEWYLEVYADAYEWVELPNTLGMALHADDGIVGTKPYISSGAYINRMSDFCKNCSYNVKEKFGEKACPFNRLYWNFLIKNEKHFKNNRRMAIAYKNLERMDKSQVDKLVTESQVYLKSLN